MSWRDVMTGAVLTAVLFVVGGSLHALHDYLQANIPGGHYLGLTVFYVFDSGIITLLFATPSCGHRSRTHSWAALLKRHIT